MKRTRLRVDSEIVLNQLDTVRPYCLSTKTFSTETAYPLNETLYYEQIPLINKV
jgi:hypothetical protein